MKPKFKALILFVLALVIRSGATNADADKGQNVVWKDTNSGVSLVFTPTLTLLSIPRLDMGNQPNEIAKCDGGIVPPGTYIVKQGGNETPGGFIAEGRRYNIGFQLLDTPDDDSGTTKKTLRLINVIENSGTVNAHGYFCEAHAPTSTIILTLEQ